LRIIPINTAGDSDAGPIVQTILVFLHGSSILTFSLSKTRSEKFVSRENQTKINSREVGNMTATIEYHAVKYIVIGL
jgi:hypothetical protein